MRYTAIIFFLSVFFFQQRVCGQEKKSCDKDSVPPNSVYNKFQEAYISFAKLGVCRIWRKDNVSIKKIHIVEINSLYIVYEKEGNLHDILIERVFKIETGYKSKPDNEWEIPKSYAVFFDENKKPYMKYDF